MDNEIIRYRKFILKELYEMYKSTGPNNYLRTAALDYEKNFTYDMDFYNALKQLIGERLVLILGADKNNRELNSEKLSSIKIIQKLTPGPKINDTALTLNPNKIRDIEKILRNWYEDPKFWIASVIALAGLLIGILQLISALK